MIKHTEELKPKQRVVTHARIGILISLMLINIMEASMRVLISGRTIAETQVEVTPFGAIPQIRTKGGNIATN